MPGQDEDDALIGSVLSGTQQGGAASDDDEGLIGSVLAQASALPAAPPPPAAPPNPWGLPQELENAVLFGQGNKVMALGVHNRLGMPYDVALSKINQMHADYSAENPGHALTADIVGALPGTAAAISAGQEYGVAPLLNSLTKAMPALGPVADFLLGRTGGGLAGKLASSVPAGVAAGGAGAALDSGLNPDRSLGDQVKTGMETGGLLNPVITAAATPLVSKIAPQVAQAAKKLIDLGIPLRAGQLPGVSPVVHALDWVFGRGANSAQRTALTGAASRTAGIDPSLPLTRQTLANNEQRLNSGFQKFANNTSIIRDPQLTSDLSAALGEAAGKPISNESYKSLSDAIDLIHNAGGGGDISGKSYLDLTKRGSDLDRLMRDSNVGEQAVDVRDALDAALERSVVAAHGRWVPGQTPGGSANNLQAPGSILAGPPNRLAIAAGGAGDIRLPTQPDTTALTGPHYDNAGGRFTMNNEPPSGNPVSGEALPPPSGPGMVWQIDPGMQGAMNDIRQLRAQWKNQKVLEPLANDTTGELNPVQLAGRIGRMYKNSAASLTNPAPEASSMMALKEAKNFVPVEEPNAPSGLAAKIKELGKYGMAGLGMEAAHYLGNLHEVLAPLALGALAAGAGKGAQVVTRNPNALLRIAQGGARAATPSANALLTPSAALLYNRPGERQQVFSPITSDVSNLLSGASTQ